MIPELRIGVDLDGVVYDFAGVLREYVLTRDLVPVRKAFPTVRAWDLHKEWGLTRAEFDSICQDAIKDNWLFRVGRPVSGALDTLYQLHWTCGIHIVTARDFGLMDLVQEATRLWLRDHGIYFDSLTFSADKTVVPVDIFIEDNVENYLALDAEGHFPVLFNQPWNEHLLTARRVWGWNQFRDMVFDRATALEG